MNLRMHSSVTALMLCLFILLGTALPAARAGHPTARAAPALRAIVADLAPATIPVYLPSWLPGFLSKYHPAAEVTEQGYGAYLLVTPGIIAHYNWAWTLFARKGMKSRNIGPGSHSVSLGKLGGTAYVDLNQHTNYGLTLTWYHGGDTYFLFGTFDPRHLPGKDPAALTLKIAQSFVRVH